MKKFRCLVMLLASLWFLSGSVKADELNPDNKAKEEIINLEQQLSQNMSENVGLNEKYYKHKLAVQQVRLLKDTTEDFILSYHKGTKYSKQIKQFVDNSFECSFIFPSLGENHMDIFIMYQRWAEAESEYNPDTISVWSKGQKIRQIVMNKHGKKTGQKYYTIKFSSKDAGILQVNDHNIKFVKAPILNLYKSGIIPFKIKEVNSFQDLLDVNTNLVARSLIETDREQRGWEYKHYRYYSMDFYNKLKAKINKLQEEGLYDPDLVQKYYYLNPIRTYSSR